MPFSYNKHLVTIASCLCPHLSWNDLLRLRRTCKSTKLAADRFLQSKKIACKSEVEINEVDKTMENFLQLNFHFKKFYLNNSVSGVDFFETAQFQKFMDTHTTSITHLRLYQMSFYLVRNEFKFFLCVENLSHLEIGRILEDKERVTRELIIRQANILGIPTKKESRYFFPLNLSNLKVLNIRAETDAELANAALFTYVSLQRLSSLSHVCVSSSFINFKPAEEERQQKITGCFHTIIKGLLERAERTLSGHSSLTKLQTFKFNEDFCDAFSVGNHPAENLIMTSGRLAAVYAFFALGIICLKIGTSMENVNAALFNEVFRLIDTKKKAEDFFRGAGIATRSLVNLHYSMIDINMPNLEKLVIHKISQTSIYADLKIRPHWPKLRELRIHADRNSLLPAPTSRTYLQDLFEGKMVTLWKALGALKEVCLDSCENVGNVSFVGDNVDDPVFLKLKNLKRLTLKGLEKMDKITDLSFTYVFRNLKLKEFYLQSDLPLTSITIVGIRSLLTGDFASSIEKFPFNGFKLDETFSPLEELLSLETQFRSSLMF